MFASGVPPPPARNVGYFVFCGFDFMSLVSCAEGSARCVNLDDGFQSANWIEAQIYGFVTGRAIKAQARLIFEECRILL